MGNFCKNCGKTLQPNWSFCPYCSNHVYHTINNKIPKIVEKSNFEAYQTANFQSEISELQKKGKKY